jgi:hypothetical protein
MDWKKTVCDFVIFKGVAVVQLFGTSIEKPWYAGGKSKTHGRQTKK